MKRTSKRIWALLLAFVMICALLPTAAFALGTKPENAVRVIVENTTFIDEDAAWDGTPVDEWVVLDDDSTMMSCILAALTACEMSCKGAENNYISSISELGEFDGGQQSGWMGTLNDWFTNEGFAAFTVAKGTLEDGDEIRVMYTCDYGADLGSSWDNNDKTVKALSFSSGSLNTAFDKATHSYTLTVPYGTTAVKVTPTASNRNFQVRTSVGETEYKRTAEVPVAEGTVITVKCGDPAWPTMNEAKDVPAETYTVTVHVAEQEPTVMKGDLNGDGEITNADVTKLKAIYLKKVSLTDSLLLLGDLNNDGEITNADVTKLKAVYLKKTTLN